MSRITVKCSDGTLIEVDKEMAVTMSAAIRKQLANKSSEEEPTITLDNISCDTLMKILEFCSVHTAPTSVPNLRTWDEKFLRLEPGELCELASAAYYLEIKPLVDLTCKSIAQLLKGKSPAEIRRTFNILYDFNPGDDVPPPTIRDKLRNKLYGAPKGKEKNNPAPKTEYKEDTRSLEELLSFIDGIQESKKSKKKKKKNSTADLIEQTTNSTSLTTAGTTTTTTTTTTILSSQEEEIISQKGTTFNHRKTKSFEEKTEKKMDEISSGNLRNSLPEPPKNNKTVAMDDEDLDPELQAQQDKEVEEFRLLLESINTNAVIRPKIHLPSMQVEQFLISLKNQKV